MRSLPHYVLSCVIVLSYLSRGVRRMLLCVVSGDGHVDVMYGGAFVWIPSVRRTLVSWFFLFFMYCFSFPLYCVYTHVFVYHSTVCEQISGYNNE
jgi:hypothetical protein